MQDKLNVINLSIFDHPNSIVLQSLQKEYSIKSFSTNNQGKLNEIFYRLTSKAIYVLEKISTKWLNTVESKILWCTYLVTQRIDCKPIVILIIVIMIY